jgi:ABC-type branched-subunit amino acid transport system ATPase component
MIEGFRLLQRFGQFDNVSAGARLTLSGFTAIFGENGRGKSTIAAMLRSLESRDPSIVTDRQRLGATQPPHIVLSVTGGTAIFDNGAWTGPTVPVAVFDDSFVAANVCSGLEIQAAHRQNLHELVLGAQGVSLKAAMDEHVRRNEQHNSDIRAKENAISIAERGGLPVDQFCALAASLTVGEDIRNKEREVEAATFADSIRQRAVFVAIDLPVFDVGSINALLARSPLNLSQEAAAHMQAHFAALGPGR